jgi:nucleotide-binding universal stress UspA family protein
MKTILVPTDFSEASAAAADYAAGLCRELGAKLILFHAYMLPVPVSEVPFVMVTAEEMQRDSEEALRKEAERIFASKNIEVETLVRMGLPTDEIKDLESEKGIDLVIMGVKNAEGMQKLIGSTTNAVIRNFRKPVLVVPPAATFNGLRKISYATDFDSRMKLQCFEPLLELVRAFQAELTIVHIKKHGSEFSAEQNAGKSRLEAIWNDLRHEYRIVENRDFEHGLINYLEEQSTDLLVVVAHQHNFLDRLFGHHTTAHLSEKTRLPLLILQDKE